MQILKKRHSLTKNKVNNFKGFGQPFPVASNKNNPDLFRVEFLHIFPDGEEIYYQPRWYQIRTMSKIERTKLQQGVNQYVKDDNVTIEDSFVFLLVALELDQYRRLNFEPDLPNSAVVYPAVKNKDEVIRYPIAHFLDKGQYYLGQKEDKLLAFAIKKTVFTPDKLEII